MPTTDNELGMMSSGCLFAAFVLLVAGRSVVIFSANSLPYDRTTTVVAAEFTKLALATTMYLRVDGDCAGLFPAIWENRRLFGLYAVPAVLYAVMNNMTFLNLKYFDPATFSVLCQFGTLITAVTFQIVFARKLSMRKWVSLVLIVTGCILKEAPKIWITSSSHSDQTADSNDLPYVIKLAMLLLQLFCSAFAGVYNELLLKKQSVPANLQNIYMYLNSIAVNIVYLICFTNPDTVKTAFSRQNWELVLGSRVAFVVLSTAFMGVTTSLFLKYLGSVVKSIANAVAVGVTALVSSVMFGTNLDNFTLLSITCVLVGCGLYTYNDPKQAAAVEIAAVKKKA